MDAAELVIADMARDVVACAGKVPWLAEHHWQVLEAAVATAQPKARAVAVIAALADSVTSCAARRFLAGRLTPAE